MDTIEALTLLIGAAIFALNVDLSTPERADRPAPTLIHREAHADDLRACSHLPHLTSRQRCGLEAL